MKLQKTIIPKEIQEEIVDKINKFNQKTFRGLLKQLSYSPEFKGKYLYLKRIEYGRISPVARLTYTGDINEWDFAIFKWSTDVMIRRNGFSQGKNLLTELLKVL